jgi:hypothetical protein
LIELRFAGACHFHDQQRAEPLILFRIGLFDAPRDRVDFTLRALKCHTIFEARHHHIVFPAASRRLFRGKRRRHEGARVTTATSVKPGVFINIRAA